MHKQRFDRVRSVRRFRPRLNYAIGFALLLAVCGLALAQAGRRPATSTEGGVMVNIVAARTDKQNAQITAKQLSVYDNGVEQTIRNFTPDPSPARIVLLVDNSLTIRADVEKLEQAAREFAYEIFEGDKLLIVGYDEEAEIVSDWTDDAKSIESSLKLFRKKGQPHLFDAASAVMEQALKNFSGQKNVIVVISDGLDRGSKTTFEKTLSELQRLDVTVYAVQAQDRTRGAIRRDVPKPRQVIDKLGRHRRNDLLNRQLLRGSKSIATNSEKPLRCSYIQQHSVCGPAAAGYVGDEGIAVRSKTAQQRN